MKIILDGIIEGLTTRAEGSVKVVFSTQELDSTKGGQLFQLRGKYCKALFSDTNISKVEEELVDNTQMAETKKPKTPSSRLRAVLFILHEQTNNQMAFEDFYRQEMEYFIQRVKEKLN